MNHLTKNNRYQIFPLIKHPNYLNIIVQQQWQCWGYHNPQEFEQLLKLELKQNLPRTWLIVDTTKWPLQDLVGSATLNFNHTEITSLSQRQCGLTYLYIQDSYRHQGLGKQLLNFCRDQADAMGYHWVNLNIPKPNKTMPNKTMNNKSSLLAVY